MKYIIPYYFLPCPGNDCKSSGVPCSDDGRAIPLRHGEDVLLGLQSFANCGLGEPVEHELAILAAAFVIVDIIFPPALDATKDKNHLHAFITQNTLSENVPAEQPWAEMLWKYPAYFIPHPSASWLCSHHAQHGLTSQTKCCGAISQRISYSTSVLSGPALHAESSGEKGLSESPRDYRSSQLSSTAPTRRALAHTDYTRSIAAGRLCATEYVLYWTYDTVFRISS
ncbi:hypothetical protein PG993_000407 [Apiospora rasikravindrae]|uniref:Uncharacterized protein n=1 Tax=Apiospora rasikravindrae TaxID=990691 RepID=A0ABR1U8H4_9PEZI